MSYRASRVRWRRFCASISRVRVLAHPASKMLRLKSTAANSEALRARYGLRRFLKEMQDHLSLLARWFYSKPREGEIFFRDTDWPYRRLLRACARILAPTRSSAGGPRRSGAL